jgi:hypothetical protein
MKISYYGNSSFLFKTKDVKLITNPLDATSKVNLKRISPDIVVTTHQSEIEENDYYIISSPGEYEVKDVFVYGYISNLSRDIHSQADAYMFDIEGVHLSILDRSVQKLSGSIIDEMGIVDVLFVSFAKESGMRISKIIDLVNKIEPYIVVPTDYTNETLETFIKSMGIKNMEKVEKLDISKRDFADEDVPIRFVVIE